MASLAGISGLTLPKFSANMDPHDAAAIQNYLYQLQEQLGYVLTNLDSSNFSADMQQSQDSGSLTTASAASREVSSKTRKK